MDLGVGEMGFIFCGKHPLLVTRTQVSDPGPMGPLVPLPLCRKTPEIRGWIRRKNENHAKANTSCSSKLGSKLESLRREIKADIWKHDLYENNFAGDVREIPETSIGTSMLRKRCPKYPSFKKAAAVALPSPILKRQRILMVSSRMCSIKKHIQVLF